METSQLKCFSETPTKRNKLTMIAEPLEEGLAEDIESGEVHRLGKAAARRLFSRSTTGTCWRRAPSGPSVPTPRAPTCSWTIRSHRRWTRSSSAPCDSVVQGFQWGCREGPLCDEPVRNAKFKILDATIARSPSTAAGVRLSPLRAVRLPSFLMASPRLEPIFELLFSLPSVRP